MPNPHNKKNTQGGNTVEQIIYVVTKGDREPSLCYSEEELIDCILEDVGVMESEMNITIQRIVSDEYWEKPK